MASSLFILQKADAISGEAEVYIINIDGVPGYMVDDPSRVKDGAIDACITKGTQLQNNLPKAHPKRSVDYPPYFEITPCVVTTWSQYQNIIETVTGAIVVNTHGQYLPVPVYFTKEQWVDKIAYAMLNRRLTWVHVGGYTFSTVWYEQTGLSEEWGEAGFQQLMTHIDKSSVNLNPPAGSESQKSNYLLPEMQIGLNWYFWDGSYDLPINAFARSDVGSPLKRDDFREHLILPLYECASDCNYLTGAVIAFAKPNARYNGDGVGAYVHMGARYLFDSSDRPFNELHDFGRGFIATAAAIWVESLEFSYSFDSAMENSYFGPDSRKAGMEVYPSVAGAWLDGGGEIRKVRILFSIYGLLQCYSSDDAFQPDHLDFSISSSPSGWDDVRMKVNLDVSKEADGYAPQLNGLYPATNPIEEKFGIAPAAIPWLLKISGVAADPVIGGILLIVGGYDLLGKWAQQGKRNTDSGIYSFDPYVCFDYVPRFRYTTIGDQNVMEYNSIIAVDFAIPKGTRKGWQILPITYEVGALTQAFACEVVVHDTIHLAVMFAEPAQIDAGIDGDAPDTYEDARMMSVATWGSHGYLGGTDNQDWYQFYVDSGKNLKSRMTPPPYVNFDLELYSPSDSTTPKISSNRGEGISDGFAYTTDEAGYWRLNVSKVQWSGVYSLDIWIVTPPGGPSCPFVSAWNGSGYVFDNNVLPRAELSNGADVEDYYRLEQIPVSKNGRYSLMLSEFESELDFFDQVQLLAVDHPSNVSVAVSSTGQVFTYTDPHPPTSAITNDHENVKSVLSSVDETYYQGYNGSYVDLNFGHELDLTHGARLVLRTDMKCAEICIEVQVQEADGCWTTVEVFNPRRFWSTDIIDMSQHLPDARGNLKVRLAFTANHKLDFVGLDTSPQTPVNVQQAGLVSAWHSQYGDVTSMLLYNDGAYAELVPGQQVQLEFMVPDNSGETRTYVFYSEGYYYTV